MLNKIRRPKIPEQTVRELLACSAGRCEFRGCNEPLQRDRLTKQGSNLGVISHIVSFSADGPRGDPIRSPKLAIDIANLMLTCRDHGKVIDDAARVAEYPETLLLEFKHEHERRIRAQTNVTEEMRTHVLLFQAPIDGYLVQIDSAAVVRALLPRYPAEEQPMLIDMGDISRVSDVQAFFSVSSGNLAKQLNHLLRRRPDGHAVIHLSVFALAPVPLLIQLGQLLGDIKHVDLFQRHRDTQDWHWKDNDAGAVYETFGENTGGDGEVGLVLSITQDINLDSVKELLGENSPLFVLRALQPSLDFFGSRQHLQAFGSEIRKLLDRLRTIAGKARKVNVFAAVPSPAAIELGRNIRPYHPRFVLWEYEKGSDTYVRALEIND